MKQEGRHKREHEIKFKPCDAGCPKNGPLQNIVIFNKDSKLREHTVKHLISKEGEPDITLNSIKDKNIQECTKELINIGCPYYTTNNFDNPPCFVNQVDCPREECLKIDGINQLENEYVSIILEDLRKCAQIPRYACYYENNKNRTGWMLTAVSNRRLIIHSHWMREYRKYNVTSCYLSKKPYLSFKEFCDKEAEKIIHKAKKDTIVFCKKENWGTITELRINQIKEKETKKGKPLTQMQLAFLKAGILMEEIKQKKQRE